MVSTMEFCTILQMFKCVQLFLFIGGDGVPFPVNSLMGYFSSGSDCFAAGLAVYPVYAAYFIVFFPVFCNIDGP
jgi:hypothetical protein